jgi:hypothetical protein
MPRCSFLQPYSTPVAFRSCSRYLEIPMTIRLMCCLEESLTRTGGVACPGAWLVRGRGLLPHVLSMREARIPSTAKNKKQNENKEPSTFALEAVRPSLPHQHRKSRSVVAGAGDTVGSSGPWGPGWPRGHSCLYMVYL